MAEAQVVQTGTQATIILGEKFLISDVPKMKGELKRLLEEGVTAVILDCSHLTLMDSTGIGLLVSAHNSLSKVNGSFSIIQVSSDIHDLLCSMRLDRHISITPMVTG
ncbi:MAG: STAS domain-containing protein [Leptolinea sp.]